MEGSNNHNSYFTAADIERYHKGQLSAKEMHALEKAALDDPFLADAIEGYAVRGVNVPVDLAELKRRLQEKTRQSKVIPIQAARSSFPWLRAAVVILFIAGAGLLSYMLLFNKKEVSVAGLDKTQQNAVTKMDTSRSVAPAQNDTPASAVPAPVTEDQANNTGEYKHAAPSRNDEPAGVTANTGVATVVPGIAAVPSADTFSLVMEQDRRANDEQVKKSTAPSEFMKSREANRSEGYQQFSYRDKKEKEIVANGMAAKKTDGAQTNPSFKFFRGRITDANNNALPFSNVTNIVDNVGTYTDARGYFTLVSTDSVLDVQVRSLGFENNRIRLRSDLPTNQVTMQEDKDMTARVLDTVKRNYARVRDGNLTLEEPEPEDGWAYYDTYLANNVHMPESFDVKSGGSGDVVELSFEVNRHGEPVNIRVEKSLCDKCDQEAIRLVKQGPKWKRKTRKGRTTVKVPFIKPGD